MSGNKKKHWLEMVWFSSQRNKAENEDSQSKAEYCSRNIFSLSRCFDSVNCLKTKRGLSFNPEYTIDYANYEQMYFFKLK